MRLFYTSYFSIGGWGSGTVYAISTVAWLLIVRKVMSPAGGGADEMTRTIP